MARLGKLSCRHKLGGAGRVGVMCYPVDNPVDNHVDNGAGKSAILLHFGAIIAHQH
jgi:hypothetical protein